MHQDQRRRNNNGQCYLALLRNFVTHEGDGTLEFPVRVLMLPNLENTISRYNPFKNTSVFCLDGFVNGAVLLCFLLLCCNVFVTFILQILSLNLLIIL